MSPEFPNSHVEPRAMTEFYLSLEAISEGLSEIESKLNAPKTRLDASEPPSTEDHQLIAATPGATQLDRSDAGGLTTIEEDMIRTRKGIDELTRDVARAVKLADTATQEFHQLAREWAQLWYENDRLREIIAEKEHRQMAELTQMRTETDEVKAVIHEHLSQDSVPPTLAFDAILLEVLPYIRQALLATDSQIEIDWSV